MTTDPLLWDVKRTAAELGLSTRYLYKLISDKEIEFVRIGRTVRFDPGYVRAWLRERTVKAVS